MIDRCSRNIQIFSHVLEFLDTDKELQAVVKRSLKNQKLYLANESVPRPKAKFSNTDVLVSKQKSFTAAGYYARQGKKVCVLNFASPTSPGGGVLSGSSAQEESLCRCSSLYPCLKTSELWDKFYLPHREDRVKKGNHDCIYTPQVRVFMEDREFPEELLREEWFSVDVLTCAAPRLTLRMTAEKCLESPTYLSTMGWRIDRILRVAALHKAEVLILGAFGCGAFNNPPEVVAQFFVKALKAYWGVFQTVEFAVFCTPSEERNFKVFEEYLGGHGLPPKTDLEKINQVYFEIQ